jgi:3-oxoacyl-[acyl-carrier-protein] synthase II
VTGRGVVTALGKDLPTTFEAMRRGASGVRTITRFDATGLPCDVAGEVDLAGLAPPDPLDRRGGWGLRLYRTALAEALAEGALPGVPRERVAVVLGCHGYIPTARDAEVVLRHTDATGRTDVRALTEDAAYGHDELFRRLPDTIPALVARHAGAGGGTLPVVSACAAGAQAIGEAARMVRDGRADVVLTGGTEQLLTFSYFLGFALLGALARKFSSPETASRPFDRRRSGFVIAEGAGALVLESLEGARARGRRVFGEVLGYGDSADAYRMTDMHPQGDGALLAMTRALADAGLGPESVEYVNAHGTSTPINDPVETLALKRLLGARAAEVPVSSNKSMIGHTIGAAGAIEAILTLEGMARGVMLPTINLETPDRRCDLDYVPNVARERPHATALSNSFGFGGQNACLCLGV